MRAMALSFLLAAGLCCILACLGGTKEKKPAAVPNGNQQGELAVDPRHQRRIDAVEDAKLEANLPGEDQVEETPLDLSHDEVRGGRPGAQISAEHFVNRFIQRKHKAKVRFSAPESLLKYYPDDQEWRAFGTLKSKDGKQGYRIECFVKLNTEDEWECSRILIDGTRNYDISTSTPETKLPNIRTEDIKNLDLEESEPEKPADTDATEKSDTSEDKAEVKAAGKLKMARLLIKRAPAKAKKRLREIIDDYPDTQAAEEARELMKRRN